jgi:fructokinase
VIAFGIDLGGTKIEAAALHPDGTFAARVRRPTPADYASALEATLRRLAGDARHQPVAGGRHAWGRGRLRVVVVRDGRYRGVTTEGARVGVEAVREPQQLVRLAQQ